MTVSRDRSTARSRQVPRGADRRRPAAPPVDPADVDLDILQDLASFYVRSVNLCLSRDLDHCMGALPVARGTGKISTLLITGANPGVRPSTIAQIIQKDRSAMVRLLDQMKGAGLLIQRVSARERRSHELYLTKKGEALAERVRAIAIAQNERFFSVLTAAEQAQLQSLLKKLYRLHLEGPAAGG
ncbi:MAG: MarR family winged helix-turn-helix transcriptional regulator [Kiloniellales bacterium]